MWLDSILKSEIMFMGISLLFAAVAHAWAYNVCDTADSAPISVLGRCVFLLFVSIGNSGDLG